MEYMTVRETSEFIKNLKENSKCSDCKRHFPSYVLSYYHRPDTVNRFSISNARNLKLTRYDVLEEISKCDLICANCNSVRNYRKELREIKERNTTFMSKEDFKKMLEEIKNEPDTDSKKSET